MRDLISIVRRSRHTALEDAAGLVSLVAMLVVGLNLSSLI